MSNMVNFKEIKEGKNYRFVLSGVEELVKISRQDDEYPITVLIGESTLYGYKAINESGEFRICFNDELYNIN